MDIPCICPVEPGSEPRHATDTVDLRPRLGFREVDTIKNSLGIMYLQDPDAGFADTFAVLREGYLLLGIESWSVVGLDGEPLPVTKPNIREHLLTRMDAAALVADAADDLYQEAVMRPLLQAASTSSPPTSTEPSTSAESGSSEESTLKPSSPSSITTIRTAGTATTSSPRDGASSSSQSSASVA